MRNVFVGAVLGLLVAGCGEAIEADQTSAADTEEEPGGDDGGGSGDDGGDDAPAQRQIGVVLMNDPGDCADNSVFLVAHGYYLDDGSPVELEECVFEFEDGTQASGCFVSRSAATLQNVVVTVTDPVTGATARATDTVQGPPAFSATLDVTTSGLTIAWEAHTLFGDVPDIGGAIVSVEPSANVVASEPDPNFMRGTVTVNAPGTYTVRLNAFITFGENGGCGAFVDKTIDVCHTDGDHAHHVH